MSVSGSGNATSGEEEEEPTWNDKSLYHWQTEEVSDIKKSYQYQWLKKASLKDIMETLIMAAQEQAQEE